MKCGTDIGEYESLSAVFIFKLCHFKAFDDYVMLHNLRMLLTYLVTLYHIQ